MRYMVKVVIFIYCSIALSSCTSLQIIRTVDEDNIFFSSTQPELRIKVNKSFTYKGNKEVAGTSRCYHDRSAHLEREVFHFENRMDNRFLNIEIAKVTTPRTYFMKEFIGVSAPLESGTIKLKNETYIYIVISDHYNSKPILIKLTKRISGPTNNISTLIIYGEIVGGSWGSPESLTDEQKNRLQDFNHNWEMAFEIF